MNRYRVAILCSVGLLVVGVVGGMLLSGDNSDPGAHWAEEDPGTTTFPEDTVNSTYNKTLASDAISDHFYTNYQSFREAHNKTTLPYAAFRLGSVSRIHSERMAKNGYVGPDSPDGKEFDASAYDDLRVSCDAVDRTVRKRTVTVVDGSGEQTDVTSEGVAATMFSNLIEEEESRNHLLREFDETTAVSVGTYIASEEADDGSTTATIYMTIDYCEGAEVEQEKEPPKPWEN